MEALFSKSFPQLKWFLKVVPPPCGVLTCTTQGPVAGLQVLHHHRLHVRASRRPRSDVSERDFQPASDSLRPYCLFPTACASGSLWRIRPIIKKRKPAQKNKTKTQTSCHDSKNRFARTHSLAAHPQQWKLYFFLTPRGNVLPSVSAARRPAKGYFHAVVPQLPSRRLHCTPLIASLPKVFLDQTAEMAQVLFKA